MKCTLNLIKTAIVLIACTNPQLEIVILADYW